MNMKRLGLVVLLSLVAGVAVAKTIRLTKPAKRALVRHFIDLKLISYSLETNRSGDGKEFLKDVLPSHATLLDDYIGLFQESADLDSYVTQLHDFFAKKTGRRTWEDLERGYSYFTDARYSYRDRLVNMERRKKYRLDNMRSTTEKIKDRIYEYKIIQSRSVGGSGSLLTLHTELVKYYQHTEASEQIKDMQSLIRNAPPFNYKLYEHEIAYLREYADQGKTPYDTVMKRAKEVLLQRMYKEKDFRDFLRGETNEEFVNTQSPTILSYLRKKQMVIVDVNEQSLQTIANKGNNQVRNAQKKFFKILEEQHSPWYGVNEQSLQTNVWEKIFNILKEQHSPWYIALWQDDPMGEISYLHLSLMSFMQGGNIHHPDYIKEIKRPR